MSRYDIVAAVIVRLADGTELVNYPINLEDVTTTNDAYRAVRDEATALVTATLQGMLLAHRAGNQLTAAEIAYHASIAAG